MFLREGVMGLLTVPAYANYFCPYSLELFVVVSKLACFSRTATSKVLWIEVDYHILLTAKIFQAHIVPIRSRETETGGLASNLDQRCTSS